MTTAISLNYGISNPETCRVEVTPSTCQIGANAVIKGSQTYTDPYNVTSHVYGMTVQNYNEGLRQPQMRTFLGPEYFNAGCTSLYCKDSQMCPSSVPAQSCERSNDMFAYLFEQQSNFTGSNPPPACFGGKCSGYDSTVGWSVSKQNPTKLQWQSAGLQGGCNTPLGM